MTEISTQNDFFLIDKYDRPDTGGHSDAIATVSAGFKNAKGLPQVSRDGKMYLHDDADNPRAPGLAAVLEQRRGRSLTVAFPFKTFAEAIQGRYVCYSASKLRWHGDEDGLTVLEGGRRFVPADTPEYDDLKARPETKTLYSIYFVLAEWGEHDNVDLIFLDGFGCYRIRTTSRKSVQKLMTALSTITNLTGAHWSGIPFEMRLVYEHTSDPKGEQRTVPLFSFTMKPAAGEFRLTSSNVRRALIAARNATKDLQLPPISREGEADLLEGSGVIDDDVGVSEKKDTKIGTSHPRGVGTSHPRGAEAEPETPTPTGQAAPDDVGADVRDHKTTNGDVQEADFADIPDDKLKNLEHNKDPEAMKRLWFATVKDSHLDNNAARADFLKANVDGVGSLSQVVGLMKPEQFSQLVALAAAQIKERTLETKAMNKLTSAQQLQPGVDSAKLQALGRLLIEAGVKRHDSYPLFSSVLGRFVYDKAELSADDVNTLILAFSKNGKYSEGRAADTLMAYGEWQASDASAEYQL